MLVISVLDKSGVSGRTPVTRVRSEQNLLEVSVVEDVGVHGPPRAGSLLTLTHEAESLGTTNESNVVLR
jgi:hypothetical protein